MDNNRNILGGKVSTEAFQLFRLLGFDSFAEALGVEGTDRDDMQYMAGLAMGHALIRKGTLPSGDMPALLEAFSEFYRRNGLGIVDSHTHGDGSMHIAIAECAGCAGAKPVGRPICHVEAGLICGVISEGLGGEYTAREVKCIGGMGDHVCEFAVQLGR